MPVAKEIIHIFAVNLEEASRRARLQAVRHVGVQVDKHIVQEPVLNRKDAIGWRGDDSGIDGWQRRQGEGEQETKARNLTAALWLGAWALIIGYKRVRVVT